MGVTGCASCAAPVFFVPSAKSGKPMILDAKPGKGIVIRNDVGEHTGPDDAAASAHVVDVYTDHHATCPDAAAWKGKHR